MRKDSEALAWLLIVPYVFVDSVNGFLVLQRGISVPLSVGYKAALIALLSMILVCWRPKLVAILALWLSITLVGPVLRYVQGDALAMTYGVSVGLRLMLLILAIGFAVRSALVNPDRFERNATLAFYCGFVVVAANVLLGHFGFGFPTYPSTGFGHKGYFVAGNELSALLVVLGSFVLWSAYGRVNRVGYTALLMLVIAVGLSLATKAAIGFVLLIGFVIPLVKSSTSLRTMFIVAFCATSLVAFLLIFLSELRGTGIWQRAAFFYERFGLLSVLFSGREELVVGAWEGFSAESLKELLTGVGESRKNFLKGHFVVEIDPIDVVLLLGMPAGAACIVLATLSVMLPLVLRNQYSKLVLTVNSALLVFAFMAGHVWTSGMLCLAWGMLNGLLWLPDKHAEGDGRDGAESSNHLLRQHGR